MHPKEAIVVGMLLRSATAGALSSRRMAREENALAVVIGSVFLTFASMENAANTTRAENMFGILARTDKHGRN
jgi:hypothetical protein